MLIFKQQNLYPKGNKTLFRQLMRDGYTKALTYAQEQKHILPKHSSLITPHYFLILEKQKFWQAFCTLSSCLSVQFVIAIYNEKGISSHIGVQLKNSGWGEREITESYSTWLFLVICSFLCIVQIEKDSTDSLTRNIFVMTPISYV